MWCRALEDEVGEGQNSVVVKYQRLFDSCMMIVLFHCSSIGSLTLFCLALVAFEVAVKKLCNYDFMMQSTFFFKCFMLI